MILLIFFFLVCCGCDTSYIVLVHIQCQASIYTFSLCRGHSWRMRLAKQETLTPPGHLVSPLVCRGPWMSTVVLYCWCHSDSASVLLYFTLVCYGESPSDTIHQTVDLKKWSKGRRISDYLQYSKSKIEKVPRDIQGEKSGKDTTCSAKLISTIEHKQVLKRDGTRCPKGCAFPAGMPQPLQKLHPNHSQFGKGQARYQCHKIGEQSDQLESHCNWWSFRMSFNIRERRFPIAVCCDPHIDHKTSWMTLSSVPDVSLYE